MQATAYIDSNRSLVGAQLRVTEWETGKEYLAGKRGEKYHDIVYYDKNCYDCQLSHISSTTTPDSDSTHWKQGDQRELVATKVLLAKNAQIQLATTNQIAVTDTGGNVVGGMQGDTSKPIFWLKDPKTSSSIEIGVNSNGTPYFKGHEQGAESDNNSDYAFLLDPYNGVYSFYGQSLQHLTVNDDGFSYADADGTQFFITTSGDYTLVGRSVDFTGISQEVDILLDGLKLVESKPVARLLGYHSVSADENGFLKINMNNINVYNPLTNEWSTYDKEHWDALT